MTTPVRLCAVAIVALAIAALNSGTRSRGSELAKDQLLRLCGWRQQREGRPGDHTAVHPIRVIEWHARSRRGGRREDPEHVLGQYSAGGSSTFRPTLWAAPQNPDGTWTTLFRVDLPALGIWRLDDRSTGRTP